jgi:hypothetical protein
MELVLFIFLHENYQNIVLKVIYLIYCPNHIIQRRFCAIMYLMLLSPFKHEVYLI